MSPADDELTESPPARPYAVVIEDDPEVAELLALILAQSGFAPVVTRDGPAGVEAVRTYRPALTTVDVALPGLDGLEVTRRIREFSSTYVVMVSAFSGEDDILGGFAAGADDYVAKPFRPRELRSRFLASTRRPPQRYDVALAAPPPPPSVAPTARPVAVTGGVTFEGEWVELRGLRLNPGEGELTVDGDPVEIGQLEFDLLELLLYAGTQVSTAGDLALSLRGERYAAESQVRDSDVALVASAMTGLLAKLGDDGVEPRWIEPVGEDGYRLVSPS